MKSKAHKRGAMGAAPPEGEENPVEPNKKLTINNYLFVETKVFHSITFIRIIHIYISQLFIGILFSKYNHRIYKWCQNITNN